MKTHFRLLLTIFGTLFVVVALILLIGNPSAKLAGRISPPCSSHASSGTAILTRASDNQRVSNAPAAPSMTCREIATSDEIPAASRDSFVRAVTDALYAVESAVAGDSAASHHAWNREQKFSATFLKDGGVKIHGGTAGNAWHGTLRLAGMGDADWRAEGRKISRTSGHVTEWYENKSAGLEHGFTLAARPEHAGNATWELEISLSGLTPESDESAPESLRFHDAATGEPRLGYRDLKVWDATGKILPATMSAMGGSVWISVRDAGAVYPVTVDPLITSLEAVTKGQVKITTPVVEMADYEEFGKSVDVSGDFAVAGAPEDGATLKSGAVYVFQKDGVEWKMKQKLADPTDDEIYDFGENVKIDGNTIAVSAMEIHQSGGESYNVGVVFLYALDGNTWVFSRKISMPLFGSEDHNFGQSLALDGGRLLIGSPARNDSGEKIPGAAFLYEKTGVSWNLVSAFSEKEMSSFGYAVALDGDTAAVTNPDKKEVLVYARAADKWPLQTRLKMAGEGSNFGIVGVALDGDTLVFNSIHLEGNGDDLANAVITSRAAVHVREGSRWTSQAEFTTQQIKLLGVLGNLEGILFAPNTIALEGNRLLTGGVTAEGEGLVNVFERSGTTWSLQQKFGSAGGGRDGFGYSIALDGTAAIIGAPEKKENDMEDRGAAYLADLSKTVSPVLPGSHSGLAVALDGNLAVLGALDAAVDGTASAGVVHIMRRSGTRWFNEATLRDVTPGAYDRFGVSVAVSGNRVVVGADSDDVDGKINCGSISVFDFSGGSWTLTKKFAPLWGNANFGRAVAVQGNTVVGGAATGEGTVLVFRNTGGSTWAQDTIAPMGPQWNANFGFSVGLSGEHLVVGEPGRGATSGTSNHGAVHFYRRKADGTWANPPVASRYGLADDGLGFSVSIDGGTAVVGSAGPAGWFSGANAGHVGRATVYTFAGESWNNTPPVYLDASGFAAGAFFGSGVSVKGDVIAVGAFGNSAQAGKVRLFRKVGGAWGRIADFTAPDSDLADGFGISVAVSGNTLLSGGYGFDARTGGATFHRFGESEITVANGAANLNDGNSAAFGNVNRGTSKTITLTVKNSGNMPLTGIATAVSGGNAAEFAVLTRLPTELSPGASAGIAVRFTPAAAGARTATLRVSSNDADENPFDIALSGVGINLPAIVVSRNGAVLADGTAEVSFATVALKKRESLFLRVTNHGEAPLENLAATVSGAAGFRVSTLPAVLAPGASADLKITFAPAKKGRARAALKITSNDPDNNPYDIALAGRSIKAPEISVATGEKRIASGKLIGFSNVPIKESAVKTFRIKNTGTRALKISGVKISGARDFRITEKPAKSVAAGKSTKLTVRFTPSRAKAATARLIIRNNDSDEKSYIVKLSGRGANAGGKYAPLPAMASAASAVAAGAEPGITVRSRGFAGRQHLVLTANPSATDGKIIVEVSSDRVSWNSGGNFTETLRDEPDLLKMRDRTPLDEDAKRFIRARILR